MSRPGDWNCRSCSHLNFQRRDSCHRCGEPRHGGGSIDYGIYGGLGGGGGVGGSRSGGGGGGSSLFGFNTGPDVRPGDWYCSVGTCGAHNFASRSSCFKCGAEKDDSFSGAGAGYDDLSRIRFGFGSGGATTSRSGWKSGDWICTRSGCGQHNFASRTECFKCNAPKESGSRSPY